MCWCLCWKKKKKRPVEAAVPPAKAKEASQRAQNDKSETALLTGAGDISDATQTSGMSTQRSTSDPNRKAPPVVVVATPKAGGSTIQKRDKEDRDDDTLHDIDRQMPVI